MFLCMPLFIFLRNDFSNNSIFVQNDLILNGSHRTFDVVYSNLKCGGFSSVNRVRVTVMFLFPEVSCRICVCVQG